MLWRQTGDEDGEIGVNMLPAFNKSVNALRCMGRFPFIPFHAYCREPHHGILIEKGKSIHAVCLWTLKQLVFLKTHLKTLSHRFYFLFPQLDCHCCFYERNANQLFVCTLFLTLIYSCNTSLPCYVISNPFLLCPIGTLGFIEKA